MAIAAHHELREQLWKRAHDPLDLIVCSGPLNVGAFVAMLPAGWGNVPRVVYFHESQWTYPSEEYDPRPYFLAHLDVVALADESWFNSRYPLETFWSTATSSAVPRRVRALANRLRPALEPKCKVVYPPISVNTSAVSHTSHRLPRRLLWNARWESDKRQDRFIQMLNRLTDAGHEFDLLMLGTGNLDASDIKADLGPHAHRATLPGHLNDRLEYESALSSADIFVSTADHEFLGVSALEAALTGVVPVLPGDLAYPETLPSAYFYHAGDMHDLSRIVGRLLDSYAGAPIAHRSDADRFSPARTVRAFDDCCQRIIAERGR